MRQRFRSGVIALLAVVAIAFAAATVDSTISTGSKGDGGPSGGTGGGAGSPAINLSDLPDAANFAFLDEVILGIAVIVGLITLFYAVRNPRSAFKAIVGMGVLTGIIMLIARYVGNVTPSRPNRSQARFTNGSILQGEEGSGGGAEVLGVSTPPPELLLLVVLVVGVIVIFMLKDSGLGGDGEPERSMPDEDAKAVGRAAGRAADRIERNVDVDNEVYRAWREMTDLLDVADPETKSPREFATAAVESGIDRADVSELTRLFEDVRYGGKDASADREETAIAVFRRIESRYAGSDQ